MNPMGSLPTSFYTSQPASLHGGQTNEPTSKPPTQQMGMNNCGQSNSNMNVRQVIIDNQFRHILLYCISAKSRG